MDVRFPGFVDNIFLNNIQDMLDQFTDEVSDTKQQPNNPSRVYVRDTKAMHGTYPSRHQRPTKCIPVHCRHARVKPSEVKVQLEDDNVLVVSGERRRDKVKDEKEGVKYVKMERRVGKFMRKFELPENANLEKISAVCQDGVLTVTVEKVPPPKPEFPKTIEVKGA